MSVAIATAIGSTRCVADMPAARRTARISSVAYATEESASEENTGSARILGRSVCSRSRLGIGRPTSRRFRTEEGGFGGRVAIAIPGILDACPCPAGLLRACTGPTRRQPTARTGTFL
jgi:hypothetical protein